MAALALAGAGAALALRTGGGSQRLTAPKHQPRLPSWLARWTLVATLPAGTAGYADPSAPNPTTLVASSWAGTPTALPVLASQPGWIEVSLLAPPRAVTPITWIRSAGVSVTQTPYRIVVDLARTRLLLFRNAKLVRCAPAAVGTAAQPTPIGHFFVSLLAPAPTAAYGAFVIVTSATANTVTDWQRSGLPTITIEGPLGSDAAIGTGGAPVTNGSVRLLAQDLNGLRGVPLGTPVDIVPGLRVPRSARHLPRHHRASAGCA